MKMNAMQRIRTFIKYHYEKPGNKLFSELRRHRINNTDFSIICNNCWGGYVYRFFGLPYNSPTIGLYIFPKDFLKLLQDIEGYLKKDLVFINPQKSNYYEELKRKGQLNVPIAKLGDIEIVFLHYKTEEEAREKWNRRASRVNYNNIIVKFSQMNGCTMDDLQIFDSLKFKKMFVFVNRKNIAEKLETGIYFKGQEKLQELQADTTFFDTYINLYDLINSSEYPRRRR